MKKGFLFCCLVYFSFAYILAADISSGLKFSSHQVIKEKRTSLLLNDGKNFDLPNGFSLNFDLQFRTELHNYGYIFRIIANDTVCFDLVSNYTDGRKSLSFIEGNHLFVPFSTKVLEAYDKNEWAHIFFSLDQKKNEIVIAFNDESIQLPCPYKDLSKYRFQFGYCNHPKFGAYDVPPMSIKNIRIDNSSGTPVAYWALREHQKAEVYDSISSRPALVFNPIWEIEKHTKWMKRKSLICGHYTQTAYNEKENLIYFADQNHVYVYSPADDRTDTITPLGGNPFYVSSNQLIYYPPTGELWSYDFDQPVVSKFNFKTQRWSRQDKILRNPVHSHHNAFISTADSNLYTFGGYGEYRYRNELLKHHRDMSQWERLKIHDSIPARYLASLGVLSGDSILIFGGYGHASGLQDFGPYNYYDLYAVNTATGNTRKLWTLDKPDEPFVGCNSMILDKERQSFYTLCFPNNQTNSRITLRSFDLADGSSDTLADTIPFQFEDINAFCSLYLDSEKKELYAVTLFHEKESSRIEIYSLHYPPLSQQSIIQPLQHRSGNLLWLYFLIGLLVLSIVGFIVIRRKKRNTALHATTTGQKPAILNIADEHHPKALPHRSAILFLGGFQVWDKNGNDITKSFTPTLKHLLILIILYTQKNGKGVSSNTLCETLWFDKSKESAQNNRRVSIRKLKVLLEEIGGIELINTNTYWATQCDSSFFCDYYTVFESLRQLRNQTQIAVNELYDLLDLLAVGQPLPYVHQEWIDSFKSDYANYVQDALWNIARSGSISDFNLLTRIADIIFMFDPTDENAIQMKCSVLVKNGKIGIAKNTYDAFCTEYERLLGIPYSKSFNDICQ